MSTTKLEVDPRGPGMIVCDRADLDEVLAIMRRHYLDAAHSHTGGWGHGGATVGITWTPDPLDPPLDRLFDVGHRATRPAQQ